MKHISKLWLLTACLLLNFPSALLANHLVKIISQPKTAAHVGTLYEYQVVETDPFMNDFPPQFKLVKAPVGMIIDTRGLIQWTPITTGLDSVEVITFKGGDTASQAFTLQVVSSFGTITGIIVNDNGEPIQGMWVLLFQGNSWAMNRFAGFLWGWTDSTGRYTISTVDSGTYFAEAMTCNPILAIPCRISDYADVWYKDSPTRDGADSIPVLNSDTVVVNFTMHKKTFGTVFGTVVNDSSRALGGIFVTLFPKNIDYTRYIPYRIYHGVTDSSGNYAIANVDTGTYLAQASSLCDTRMTIICFNSEYADVWYKDSPDIYGAAPIPVQSSGTVRVDFTMHKKIIPVPVKISGTVTDTSGNPVGNALIVFTRFWKSPVVMPAGTGEPALPNIQINFSNDSFRESVNVAGYAKSDSSGKYTLTMLSGGPYIAASFAHGYLLQFFNQKSNVLEADRITLGGDSTGIDFRLVPKPLAPWKLSGSVHDSAGSGISSTVVLYRRGVPFFGTEFVRCTQTDSLGNFVLENLPNGSYLAQAIPFQDYLPSFYKTSACGVYRWKNAGTIAIHDADVSGIDICVRPASTNGGGTISGHVGTPDGISVAGVVIEAQAASDASVSTYAITDVNGNYTLMLLGEGAYTITADKVGYQSDQTQTNTVDYTKQSSPSDFQLKAEQVTSVENPTSEIPERYTLLQNYPNPFNPSTTIQYGLPVRSQIKIEVFNMLGQTVKVLTNTVQNAGYHKVEWNAQVSSGIYFYRITAVSLSDPAKSFIDVKKMLLLK